MAEPIILQLSKDTPDLDALLVGITHVHGSCIAHDRTMATFTPPLSQPKILTWWNERYDECAVGRRHIYVALAATSTRRAGLASPFADEGAEPVHVDDDPGRDYEVAGVVAISMPVSETGPFRAEVEKLLVSPNHRHKGVATALMTALERTALCEGRFHLMLDTVVGTPAERVYAKLGYVRVGVVPAHGYSPMEQKWTDGVWFYKDLRHGTL